jgi:putative membrane protein
MDRRLVWFIALLAPVLGWSAIGPHDRFTWFLEVVPVLIGVPLAVAVQRRFPLSSLLLVLLWWHSVILIVGGHYTYARVPLGDWAMEWFGWKRNNYDKVGHFAQGFVPAILAREILLRLSPLGAARPGTEGTGPFGDASACAKATADTQGSDSRRVLRPSRVDGGAGTAGPFGGPQGTCSGRPSKWLPFLCVCVCLAFSAFYELIEWWVAVASGAAADDFLGTQGYAWDTQSDMAWALGGAIAALALLRRWHDRSLARLAVGP